MYIPMEWLRKTENETEVRTLLSNVGGCLRFADDIMKLELRLQELGEDKILQELKKGTFAE